MKGFVRIDTSLSQRNDLVRLLQRLEREDLSFDEMEEIADAVQAAGQRAIPPMMRRLGKVTKAAVIARYLYLLEFFDTSCWFDELVRISLVRKDLEVEAKKIFLAGLERLGIDIDDLPIACCSGYADRVSANNLEEILNRGATGFVSFMEDFACCSHEYQVLLVRRLATAEGPAAESLLEVLLGYSDREVVKEAIGALGRIRRSSAATVLMRYLQRGNGPNRSLAERNLRKMAFLGVFPEPDAVVLADTAILHAALSPIEGTGFRSAWLSRSNGKGGVDVLLLQIHEICGITEASGFGELSLKEHDILFRKAVFEDGLLEVSPAYAQAILRDALFQNVDKGFSIPAEIQVRQQTLGDGALPAPHVPDFCGFDLDGIAASSQLLEAADTLLDDGCCAGWFSAQERVFDIAEKLMHSAEMGAAKLSERNLANLLKQFMHEVVAPEKNRLARRLFLTADLLRETEGERELVERTLCVAFNVVSGKVPYIKNPFLRRFALDSLSFACDAIAAGYDLRNCESDWDDGALWD